MVNSLGQLASHLPVGGEQSGEQDNWPLTYQLVVNSLGQLASHLPVGGEQSQTIGLSLPVGGEQSQTIGLSPTSWW